MYKTSTSLLNLYIGNYCPVFVKIRELSAIYFINNVISFYLTIHRKSLKGLSNHFICTLYVQLISNSLRQRTTNTA